MEVKKKIRKKDAHGETWLCMFDSVEPGWESLGCVRVKTLESVR